MEDPTYYVALDPEQFEALKEYMLYLLGAVFGLVVAVTWKG